jgi:hypothetical protein
VAGSPFVAGPEASSLHSGERPASQHALASGVSPLISTLDGHSSSIPPPSSPPRAPP